MCALDWAPAWTARAVVAAKLCVGVTWAADVCYAPVIDCFCRFIQEIGFWDLLDGAATLQLEGCGYHEPRVAHDAEAQRLPPQDHAEV